MKESIFTKIVKGEIPCHKIAESDKFLAFLDINPLVKGHTLVIPKIQEDKFFSLEDDVLAEMIVFAKGVANAIEKFASCNRVGVSVIGLEVPHAHIHLIPINGMSDMNFANPKLSLEREELNRISKEIRGHYQ